MLLFYLVYMRYSSQVPNTTLQLCNPNISSYQWLTNQHETAGRSACGVCIRLRHAPGSSKFAGCRPNTKRITTPCTVHSRKHTQGESTLSEKPRHRPPQAVSTSSSIMSTILAMSFSRSLSSPLMFRLSSAFCAILMSSGFVGILP